MRVCPQVPVCRLYKQGLTKEIVGIMFDNRAQKSYKR